MRLAALLLLLALPVAAQTTRITSGDNFVAATVIGDASGNGNTGTNINAATSVVGTNGRALSFNGTSQYVQAPNSASLSQTDNFSVTLWCRMRSFVSTGDRYTPLVVKASSTLLANYALGSSSYGGSFQKFDFAIKNTTQASATSGRTNDLNRWYCVVATVSNKFMRLYEDGDLVGTNSFSPSIPTGGNLQIGYGGGWGYTNFFVNGDLDDIRIYNRALASNEVVSVYQGSAPTNGLVAYYPLDDGSYQTGLVGWWTFEELASATTVADRSGNGRALTLVSGPTLVDGYMGKSLRNFGTLNSTARTNGWFSVATQTQGTVVAWSRINNAGNDAFIFYGYDGGNTRCYLSAGTNAAGLFLSAGYGPIGGEFPSPVAQGIWNHGALTWNGTLCRFYVNAALVGSTNVTVSGSTGIRYLHVSNYQTGNLPLNGMIDDVRIYNRALSAGEISSLYNSRRHLYGGQ